MVSAAVGSLSALQIPSPLKQDAEIRRGGAIASFVATAVRSFCGFDNALREAELETMLGEVKAIEHEYEKLSLPS